MQKEQVEQDRRMIQRQIEQEDAELAECTFQPEIRQAPGYVQRIAKSMALTRSSRTPAKKGPGREWR